MSQDRFADAQNEQIRRLIKGEFEYDSVRLSLSQTRIELDVLPNEMADFVLSMHAPQGRIVSGKVMASSWRIILSQSTFEGNQIDINYRFNSNGLEEGDVLKAEISIISNAGEYTIPVVASIRHMSIQSSIGPIRNLFHFTNLAQKDFAEALDVFYSPTFKEIFTNQDRKFADLYRGFSSGLATEKHKTAKPLVLGMAPEDDQVLEEISQKELRCRNMEEFLVAVRKKKPVTFTLDEKLFQITTRDEESRTLCLRKSSWGYIHVHVQVEGDFLEVFAADLTEDNFVGNRCEFQVRIHPEHLHGGKNLGRVIFFWPGGQETAVFEVRRTEMYVDSVRKTVRRQVFLCELTKTYLEFRIHNINQESWERRSQSLIDQMLAMNPDDAQALLYQAHIQISSSHLTEAKQLIENLHANGSLADSPALEAYALYLSCMISKDAGEIKRCAQLVNHLYMANGRHAMLLWILMYLDEELLKDPAKQLIMMRHQQKVGGVGPLLYLEAFRIFKTNPSLLTELGAFERQVIHFAVRTRLFSPDLAKQIVYVSGKARTYDELTCRILESLFEKYQSSEILATLCSHLILGNRKDEKAFSWYALAIERELRITKLYEFFLDSVPEDYAKPIPKIAMLYFRYTDAADEKKKAFLYANLIQFCPDEEMLASYREQMIAFAVEQIEKGCISSELSILYHYLASEPMVFRQICSNLSEIVFVHRVISRNERAKKLIVVELAFHKIRTFPLVGGEAFVPVFGKDYVYLLEDENGVRFCDDASIREEILMRPLDYAEAMERVSDPSIGICLCMSEQNRHYVAVDHTNHRFVKRIVENPNVVREFKSEYIDQLLQFYFDQDRMEELDEVLVSLPCEDADPSLRAKLIEFMMRRGLQEEVLRLLSTYGAERVNSKVLSRYASHMVAATEMEYDEFLLELCLTVYLTGKYDSRIMKYLALWSEGTTKSLRNLWRTVRELGEDTFALEERILGQMLFTRAFVGEREDIVNHYMQNGGKKEYGIAYLSYNAWDYFVQDAVVDDAFFERLIDAERGNDILCEVCHLALIHYFAQERAMGRVSPLWNADAKNIVVRCINDFMRRRIVLEDFMQFAEEVPALSLYEGRVFVEYKADVRSIVTLMYVLSHDDDDSNEYTKETMRVLREGIFAKNFLLFFGETLTYYVSEEKDEKKIITESQLIDRSDITMGSSDSRYDVLNDMLVCLSMREEASLLGMMDVYRRRKYISDHIFTLK